MLALDLALVFALMLLNGFFSMSELAIVSARRARLQQRAANGSRGAAVALSLSENPTRFLSTVQIGITSIGIFAGALSGATIAEPLATNLIIGGMEADIAEPLSLAVVVLALTFLSLIVGELVPKRLALNHPDAIASYAAPLINAIARSTHPVVTILQVTTEGVLRFFGAASPSRAAVSDEEINALVAEGAQQGVIQPAERAMVEEVLRLADRPVRTIMTHRRDLIWLDIADSAAEMRRKMIANAHSRLLVCDGSLDNCLGYVRSMDLADRLLDGGAADLSALLREPLTVSPELKTLELMSRFRRARPHLALIVDEYGATQGVVTPGDILETIAGDLATDSVASAPVIRRQDGSWIVDAQLEVHELERALGSGGLARTPEFKTLAALVLEKLDRIPQEGEVLMLNDWRLEVVDLDGQRIDKVIISRLPVRRAAM